MHKKFGMARMEYLGSRQKSYSWTERRKLW